MKTPCIPMTTKHEVPSIQIATRDTSHSIPFKKKQPVRILHPFISRITKIVYKYKFPLPFPRNNAFPQFFLKKCSSQNCPPPPWVTFPSLTTKYFPDSLNCSFTQPCPWWTLATHHFPPFPAASTLWSLP